MDMDVTIMKINFNAHCALQYCAPYKKYMLPSTKGFLINGAFDPRHWHRHARRHLHLELLRPLAWLGIVQFQKLFAICLGVVHCHNMVRVAWRRRVLTLVSDSISS